MYVFCVWFCVCVCEYEGTLGPCMHMWRSEVDVGCPLLLSVVSPYCLILVLELNLEVTVYTSLDGQKFPGYAISVP